LYLGFRSRLNAERGFPVSQQRKIHSENSHPGETRLSSFPQLFDTNCFESRFTFFIPAFAGMTGEHSCDFLPAQQRMNREKTF